MTNWKGLRVLIIGAARQGLALARYLSGQGAVVTLNDRGSTEQMQSAVQSLSAYPVKWVLGEHPTQLLDDCDLVCVSGGVPLSLPLILEAQQRGISLTNDSQIFMDEVPCPVIGITGSAGKTTTTTLVGRMATAAMTSPRRVWVGGNIGLPLIDFLGEIRTEDIVVLELSSFQLELMHTSPQIAAVLNITPNHLDRHGTFSDYAAAKARILLHQKADDISILNRDDGGSWALASRAAGRLITFGANQPVAGEDGSWLAGERLMLRDGGRESVLIPVGLIELRGGHNRLNVLAACTIAYAAGFSSEAMRAGVIGFKGVAHRLELVRSLHGVNWFNDSIATAPERTMAAIQSFEEPLVLLLGGRDKNLPWDSLAKLVNSRARHVVLFGEAGAMIEQVLQRHAGSQTLSITRVKDLQSAVKTAAQLVQPGDIVLLSPGGTSYDEFTDFEERGERYRQWVHQLM